MYGVRLQTFSQDTVYASPYQSHRMPCLQGLYTEKGCATRLLALRSPVPTILPWWGLAPIMHENSPNPAPSIDHSKPSSLQNPHEAQCKVVEAIHDELQADQHAHQYAHDEHCGGPRSPRHGAEEDDEGEDGDKERDKG